MCVFVFGVDGTNRVTNDMTSSFRAAENRNLFCRSCFGTPCFLSFCFLSFCFLSALARLWPWLFIPKDMPNTGKHTEHGETARRPRKGTAHALAEGSGPIVPDRRIVSGLVKVGSMLGARFVLRAISMWHETLLFLLLCSAWYQRFCRKRMPKRLEICGLCPPTRICSPALPTHFAIEHTHNTQADRTFNMCSVCDEGRNGVVHSCRRIARFGWPTRQSPPPHSPNFLLFIEGIGRESWTA